MADDDHDASGGAGSETSFIARHFAPLARNYAGAFGLLDDAAAITPPAGADLVVTTDALIADVHFLSDDDPADIAFKALAVNISDLAAKAADPIAYSLALAMTHGTPDGWVAQFARGLGQAQAAFGIAMSGGDTTASPKGPLMISITAFGHVPKGRMVRRGTAQAGDRLFVTGTIGDAALGLKVRLNDGDAQSWPLDDPAREALLRRYLRPAPCLALRDALLAHASAAMDISDGLVIDCARMCAASGVAARIEAARVPLSPAVSRVVDARPTLIEAVLTGGDDYEILAAIRAGEAADFTRLANAAGVPVKEIGVMSEGDAAVRVCRADGTSLPLSRLGYDHLIR